MPEKLTRLLTTLRIMPARLPASTLNESIVSLPKKRSGDLAVVGGDNLGFKARPGYKQLLIQILMYHPKEMVEALVEGLDDVSRKAPDQSSFSSPTGESFRLLGQRLERQLGLAFRLSANLDEDSGLWNLSKLSNVEVPKVQDWREEMFEDGGADTSLLQSQA